MEQPSMSPSCLVGDVTEDHVDSSQRMRTVYDDLHRVLSLLIYIEDDLLTISPDAAKCIKAARLILKHMNTGQHGSLRCSAGKADTLL